MKATLLAFAALALMTAPALAHGWVTPPYQGPVGGGTSAYQGPTGGGGLGPTAQPPAAEDTRTTPAPSTPPDTEPGVATSGTSRQPSARPVPVRRATQGSHGMSAQPRKPKSVKAPWLKNIRIPWTAAFAPVVNHGYSSGVDTLEFAVTASFDDGGWFRDDDLGSVVLVYDPTDESHQKTLDALEANGTFKIGSQFFNCFRVDGRGLGKVADISLTVYQRTGTRVGRIEGTRNLRKGEKLLTQAYEADRGEPLSRVLPRMDRLLDIQAAHEHYIRTLEGGIVCPDCGHERHDVVERIKEFSLRNTNVEKAIAKLKRFD